MNPAVAAHYLNVFVPHRVNEDGKPRNPASAGPKCQEVHTDFDEAMGEYADARDRFIWRGHDYAYTVIVKNDATPRVIELSLYYGDWQLRRNAEIEDARRLRQKQVGL